MLVLSDNNIGDEAAIELARLLAAGAYRESRFHHGSGQADTRRPFVPSSATDGSLHLRAIRIRLRTDQNAEHLFRRALAVPKWFLAVPSPRAAALALSVSFSLQPYVLS